MNKKEIKESLKKFMESRNLKRAIYILGALFILFFVFQAGMVTGFKKASFGRDWGNNYEKNFGPKHNAPRFMRDNLREMPNAHGAIGRIIKVELPNVVVLDKDQIEKVIVIKEDTSILERREKINKEALLVDKFIVVIGNPNQLGQIEAKLIRIMPSPEEMISGPISKVSNKLMSEVNNRNI